MIPLNPFATTPRERDGLPVLPGAFPLVGHIPALYRHAPDVFRKGCDDLGPLFWLTAGPGVWLLYYGGRDAVDVLKGKAFTNGHLQRVSPLVARGSLLAQDGDAHRRMRSALNGPFLPRGLAATSVGAMMAGAIEERVARWASAKRLIVLKETRELTLEIIFRMIGIEPKDLPAWREQYRELLLANLSIPIMLPGFPAHRAAKAQRWINARFLEIVEAARRTPDASSLVAALVNGRDEDGRGLTDEELVDNLRLLVLGGHETLAATMAWLIIALAGHPGLWERLCEEASKAPGVPASPQEARDLPFAEALFRETVRMYPAFGVMTRMAAEPTVLAGRAIARETSVAVDLWRASHDPSVFEDPDEFRPSRWLGLGRAPTQIEIAQFGAGPHFCLGYHLAWLETVQLATALGRTLGRRGQRPRLVDGEIPAPIFVPTTHPPPKTAVAFA